MLAFAYGSISPEDIVSEVTLIEEVPPSIALVQGEKGADAKDTIAAIVDLKAYTQVASANSFYRNFVDKKKNALFALIDAFSQPAKENDIVTQYGMMMGKLLDKKRGIVKYLLENVNSRILQGQTVIVNAPEDEDDDKKTPKMSYDYANLGLMDNPEYIVKLAVNANAFQDAKMNLHADDGGKAIANWIKSGTATIFDKCFKTTMAKNAMKAANMYTECAKACAKVIHADYLAEDAKKGVKKAGEGLESHNQDVLAPLPTSCTDGTWSDAPAACDWKEPSADEVKSSCTASTDAKMKKAAEEVTLARIENDLEDNEEKRKDQFEAGEAKAAAAAIAPCKDPEFPHKHATKDVCYSEAGWLAGGKSGSAPCNSGESPNWCNIPGGAHPGDGCPSPPTCGEEEEDFL